MRRELSGGQWHSTTSRSRMIVGIAVAWLFFPAAVLADDWPQWLGPKRDAIWREDGILKKFPPGGLKVLWRKPIGSGYTGPAVAGGRVFVMDRFPPTDEVGKAPPLGEGEKHHERILCLDAKTGEQLWKHEYEVVFKGLSYPFGARTTPLVEGDKVYTLGAMGDLLCLDSSSGNVNWHKNIPQEYKAPVPLWGYSAHPLIIGDALFTLAGGDGSAIVALNKRDGKEKWRNLSSKDVGYAPPTLVEVDGIPHLIVWLSESLNGLDPNDGKVRWSVPYPENGKPQRPAVNIITPKQVGDLVYVSTVYHGGLTMKLKGKTAGVAWRTSARDNKMTQGLRILMATPIERDGYLYGVSAFGELRCIKADNGQQVWENMDIFDQKQAFCGTVFMVSHGDRDFLFDDMGNLIIARLSPKGYEQIDRTPLIKPSQHSKGRDVVWSQPAFANRCIFVRNDREILCASLAEDKAKE
jgi:outer membrane protein assembly factor BamB